MTENISNRIQFLEEKFAHQERLVDALNEVIIEQQAQIGMLIEQFHSIRDLLEARQGQALGHQEPPPPHY